MTNYEEIVDRCYDCPGFDKCRSALINTIWMTNIPWPDDIHCNYFPILGPAIKEYVQAKIYEVMKKDLEDIVNERDARIQK